MSRSPKYSFAQLGKKVRDQIQRDREDRRRRRDTAEARIRDRLLAEGRAELLERHRLLGARLSGLAAAPGAAAAESALADAGRHSRGAATFAELTAATGELDRAEEAIDRLRGGAAPEAVAGRAEQESQRRKAGARIEQLAARLEDLRDDGRAAHVPLRDGDRAEEALALLRDRFATAEYADVLRLGTALERRVDAIESDLDAVIDQLAERRTILTALVRALPDVGFSVDPGSLTESADGAIGLRAVRPGGESLAVIVEAEAGEGHRVLYASGTLRQEEQLGRGSAACGNLLEVIDVVQESAGHDGVVLGEVSWEGRDGREVPAATARRVTPPAAEGGRHRQENPPWRP